MAGTVAVLLFFSTCDLPPSFGDEYFDSSINYIRYFPLAAPSPTADSLGNTDPDTSGAWDWAWRGIMGNNFDYMKLELQDSLEEPGPTGTEEVWRLELVNLFRNGTFETGLTAGDISLSLGLSTATIELFPLGNPIHGNGLLIESIDSNGLVGFSMPDLLIDPADDNYSYFMRLVLSPAKPFDYTVGSVKSTATPAGNSLFITDSLSGFGTGNFSFGPQIINPTYIDEFRVVRGDKKDSMYLRLLLLPQETSPSLVPGYYEFSVWVKRPLNSHFFDDHTNRNSSPDAPYALPSVTLGIRQLISYDALGGGAEVFPVSSSWTKWSYRLPTGSNIQRFDEASEEAVIEVYIIPGDNTAPDAGAILIAEPSLNFYINN